MKKGFALLLCMALALSLTACGGGTEESAEESADVEVIIEDTSVEEVEDEDDADAVLEVDAPEVDTQGAYLVLDAFDAYDGPYSFVTDGAGTYTFTTTNAEGYEDITWSVYLFDDEVEEIEEGEVPALTGDGSIELAAGQYVYCVCSYNNASQEQAVSGASTLVITFEADEAEQADTSTVTIDAADAYDSGAFSFRASQSGTYQAVSTTAEGFSPADVGCDAEEVEWTFYVLDEPFDDAVRYLPQACDSVLEGDGSFEVEQGQYVYCMCNISAFTADEMPEGKNTLTLTMEGLADTTQMTVDAAEVYDSGFFSFRASQTGSYQAVIATADDFSPADVGCDAEEVEWEFYVLDEPADDMQDLRTENFFPSQSKTARCYIDEEIDVTQGDYVYCRCNVSADTADEMPEGKSELTLTLEPLEDTTHVMVDANYTYDNMFYSFRASQSGTYQVVNATAEGEEDVNWIIYVMDRYFDDAYRYIYSAYPAVLIGEGSFTVEEGQYVYISTDHSNYSGYDPVPEGENILTLFMEDESTDAT